MSRVPPSTEPQRVERDGVPVFWAQGPGPCTGALLVRSGKVDETARISGMNHLVEHMALFPIGRPAYSYNGRVEDTVTLFYASGEAEEVASFLGQVCATLKDLPLERLAVERRILLTEADGRDMGIDGRLLALRFGAQGYGMPNVEELGLGWLEGEDVQRWVAERFTTGNAVAWMSAEPPEDLSLALAPGPAIPPPAPEPLASLQLPAEVEQGTGGIAFSTLAPRSAALNAAIAIAAERAHERLRREAGLSYSVSGGYLPLDAAMVHATLYADCRDSDAGRVRDELLAVVEELADAGPTAEELEFDRRQFARANEDPEAVLGGTTETVAQLVAEREALAPAEVARAPAAAAESLLVVVPTGTGSRPKKLKPTPPPARRSSTGRVTSRRRPGGTGRRPRWWWSARWASPSRTCTGRSRSPSSTRSASPPCRL